MGFEKLYPGAPACAPEPARFVAAREAFCPPGEAVPPPGAAVDLADTRNPYTPPPPLQGREAARTTARGPGRPAGKKKPPPPRQLLQGLRAERYRLLSEARSILVAAGARRGLEYPHNFHRTAKCKYVACGQVGVLFDKAHSAAFYAGLTTCGSLWTCPICAAKVQEKRRAEVQKGIDWAYDAGLQPALVTLTFPHGRHQQLGQLLEQQAEALRLMRVGAPWQRFKSAVGYQGVIRSLELTHGANGWHPHTHELWFVGKKADAEGMQREILKRWESACIRAGLLTPEKVELFRIYAVDVQGWCSTGDYLAKHDDERNHTWGADRELAKGGSKIGKITGKHPFALLAAAADGDRRSKRLFLTYAIAMRGKRQLLWSRGLKARAGVKDKSDEQLAEESCEEADVLGLVGTSDWQRVRRYECRAQLLDAAEAGGWPAVQAVLDCLAKHAQSPHPGPPSLPPPPPGRGPRRALGEPPEGPAEQPPGKALGERQRPLGEPSESSSLRSKVLGERFELKKPIISHTTDFLPAGCSP